MSKLREFFWSSYGASVAIIIFLFVLSAFLFHKISVEIPQAVLTGVIASGVTLIGVILNNYFVAKQSDKQLVHQQQIFDEQMSYQREALEKQLRQQNETQEKQIQHQDERLSRELQYQSDKLEKELNYKFLESEKERLFKLRNEAYREFSIERQKISIYFIDFRKLNFEQDDPSPVFLSYMNSIAQVTYLLDERNLPLQRSIMQFLLRPI